MNLEKNHPRYGAQDHAAWFVGTLLVVSCISSCATPTSTFPRRVETGSTVNLTQAAQLAKTEYIEVAAFNVDATSTSASTSAYTVTHTLRDPGLIRQVTVALDQEVTVGMAPACIAQYEVRFYRSDRVVATFAYFCRDGKPYFIRGTTSDKSFELGGEVPLPSAARDALAPYLS